MTKHAAFFRNLNLGRANCPTRAQFEAAFLEAGAASAQSFLVNGTMVFATRSDAQARKVLSAARKALHASCGLQEPAFLRRVEDLAAMVAADPFQQVDAASVYACCVTFLHADASVPAQAPRLSARGDVELIDVAADAVFSVVRVVGRSPGSPNAFLEKLLGLPATTRVWNTVVRLVDKHA
jgi:uncharacterized protein (DUF1697 family)